MIDEPRLEMTFPLALWQKFMPTPFDETQRFHDELEPLLDKIYNLCVEMGLPFSFYACPLQMPNGCELFQMHHIPKDLGRTAGEMLLRMPYEVYGVDLVRYLATVARASEIKKDLMREQNERASKATKQ